MPLPKRYCRSTVFRKHFDRMALKLLSKTHFYGRAAAEEVFSEGGERHALLVEREARLPRSQLTAAMEAQWRHSRGAPRGCLHGGHHDYGRMLLDGFHHRSSVIGHRSFGSMVKACIPASRR